MSSYLQKSKEFILFLLKTPSKTQKAALLNYITKDQVLAIAEIFKNLESLNISGKTKALLKKHPRIYKKLKSKLLNKRVLIRNIRFILRVLATIKDFILQILS